MERFDKEEIEKLVPLIKEGNKGAIDKAIVAFRILAASVARKYSRRSRADFDDLCSEGFMAIIKAVPKIGADPTKRHDPTTFVLTSIKRAIQRFIAQDHVVRVPRVAYSKGIRRSRGRIQEPVTLPPSPKFEIEELYAELPDNERLIVELKMEGYTYQEIGERFNLSRQRVHQIKGHIQSELASRFEDTHAAYSN